MHVNYQAVRDSALQLINEIAQMSETHSSNL